MFRLEADDSGFDYQRSFIAEPVVSFIEYNGSDDQLLKQIYIYLKSILEVVVNDQ